MPYLEDIAVGDTRAYGRYEVSREEVLAFARAYDPQPFHLSDEAAAQTHFGRLAASGWHTSAMMMAMTVAAMPGDGTALGAAGIDELRWLKPVHPGDVLRCEAEIIEVTPSRSKPDIGSVRTRTTVINQDDVPVMRLVSIVIVKRRPGSTPKA